MLPIHYSSEKKQIELDRKTIEDKKEILFPSVIKSEVNFLVLPFFALWDKDVRKKILTEYKAVIERNSQKMEISWLVSANPKFGYPGPFDKEVYKAIEQIIGELPKPVQNPIPLGSLYSLYKRMRISTFGGQEYKKIKKALTRIITTTVISKGTFYSKEKKEWIEDIFHLYERVVFKGEKLSDGNIADTNYLYLNSWYLDNINAHYVKPIDWEYYKSLEMPVTQRLYELLSVKFYGLLLKKGKYLSYRYSTLCDLMPVARQKYFSDAKKVFAPAHKRLKDTGFLDDWTWDEIRPKGKSNDWIISYYPGRRAKMEIQRFKLGEQLELQFELPLPEKEMAIDSAAKLSVEESDITEQLIQRGITNSAAKKLVRTHRIEQIQKQIEIFDFLKKTNSPLVEKNQAGFLRKSIEENYEAPADFIRKQKKELIEQKNTQEMIENEKEQARLDEIQRQIDDYRERLDEKEQKLLRQEAMELIKCDKAIKKEFVSDILIRVKESEIIRKRLGLELEM